MAISKVIYKTSAQDAGTVWMDATPATAAAADITAPKTAMLADGVLTTGTGSGGGSVTVDEKDVNFIDYDGTILYSYTKTEFASLSALPANPSHAGLTAQGWNWSLSDAKTYVASYGKLWIGQMYVTDDGKTRLYIHIPDDTPAEKLTMYVRFTQTVSYGVSVDWGDGSAAETYSGTTATNRSHTYATTGDYKITLNVVNGKVSFVGTDSNSIFGAASYNRVRIYKAEIGSDVTTIGDYAFSKSYALQTITIPSSTTSIGANVFYYCKALKSITIPNGTSSVGNQFCRECTSLEYAAIPKSVTSFGNYNFTQTSIKSFSIPPNCTAIPSNMFNGCRFLQSVVIPSGVTELATYAFGSCYMLKSLSLPSSVTTIGTYVFTTCFLMATPIIIPSGVTSIGGSAFNSCYSVNTYHVIPTTPPTLGTSVFSNITTGTIIYVPYSADHSILEAYQTATNWSAYASYMQEEPQ